MTEEMNLEADWLDIKAKPPAWEGPKVLYLPRRGSGLHSMTLTEVECVGEALQVKQMGKTYDCWCYREKRLLYAGMCASGLTVHHARRPSRSPKSYFYLNIEDAVAKLEEWRQAYIPGAKEHLVRMLAEAEERLSWVRNAEAIIKASVPLDVESILARCKDKG